MYQSCIQKQERLKQLIQPLNRDEKYHKIIELGKLLKPYPTDLQIDENQVRGCQSQMFLSSTLIDGLVHFHVTSDALISKGLAALLIYIYDNEPPETILKCQPTILAELGIPSIISPSRSNGLTSLYTRMQQEALKYLMA